MLTLRVIGFATGKLLDNSSHERTAGELAYRGSLEGIIRLKFQSRGIVAYGSEPGQHLVEHQGTASVV